MNGNKVNTAFDILIDQINDFIPCLNELGATAFIRGEYDQVQKIKDTVADITNLLPNVQALRQKWIEIIPPLPDMETGDTGEPGSENLDPGLSRITIKVTYGSLNNQYMRVGHVKGFFPKESFGKGNLREGEGKKLKLNISGINQPIETDIDRKIGIFRRRGWCADFYRIHGVKVGDEVVIEKVSDYEYRIFPKEETGK